MQETGVYMSVEKKVCLMQGNEALAEGALAAGVQFFAGYPITPATDVAEYFSRRLPARGGVFVQMEDELACMGALCGASMAGAKAMTATSGPGFTLMQENLGYASMAELPCVILDVQRGGPSTGAATKTSQADVMAAKWGSHGDHPVVALSPGSVRECYDVAIEAFNIAEKYRVPVIILSEEAVGHMCESVELPENAHEILTRAKPEPGLADFKPYDLKGAKVDGVPLMSVIGDGYHTFTTGAVHDESGAVKINDPEIARNLLTRLGTKIENNADDIVRFEKVDAEDAKVLVVAYGSVGRSAREAVEQARASGISAGLFRPITLWPSPEKQLLEALKSADAVVVAEMNAGQYTREIQRIVSKADHLIRVESVLEQGSTPILPETICAKIMEVYEECR